MYFEYPNKEKLNMVYKSRNKVIFCLLGNINSYIYGNYWIVEMHHHRVAWNRGNLQN